MIREILVMHHSHTDIGYTHAQPVWWELSRRYLDEALDLCELTRDYPEESRMRWTCENTAPLLDWLNHASARQVDRFVEANQRGQISVGALPFNLTPLADLEQLSRGLRLVAGLREKYGLSILSAIQHDVNGVAWPAVQLLREAGVKLLILGINTHFGGYPLHRPLVFNWAGMNGGGLLSYNGLTYTLFDGVSNMHRLNIADMASGIEQSLMLVPPEYPYDFLFLTATHRPWLNDNNPPNPWLPELIRQWNAEGREPKIRIITPEMYLERLQALPSESIPVHSGDWTDYWSFGAGSAAVETRISQRVRSRLAAAGLLGAGIGKSDPISTQEEREGYHSLNLWTEHTWSAEDTLAEVISDNVREVWAHKISYLYNARSQAQLLMRDRLEAFCANPRHAHGLRELVIFNPAPVARKEMIRIPNELVARNADMGNWMHFSSVVMRLDRFQELANMRANGLLVGPVEVPANGWRVLALDSLTAAVIPEVIGAGPGWLESPYYRLEYDPLSGKVISLIDKANGWQVLDVDSRWDFAGLVWEHLETGSADTPPYFGRDVFFKLQGASEDEDPWIPDWPALREKPAGQLSCTVELTPKGAVLTRRWDGAGIDRAEQQICLLSQRAAICIDTQFHMADRINAESYYITFPFNLAGWQAHYDTAELPVEFDREQLPGACRDWQCVTRWVSLSDDAHGVTMASPDGPMVQIGGFHWGKHQRKVGGREEALFLGWLTNNYWNTNFPAAQPGFIRHHYELTAHGPYNAYLSMELGLLAAHELEVHPVVLGGQLAASGQIIRVDGEGVILLYTGLEEEGAVRARVFNTRIEPARARIALPERAIVRAEVVDVLMEATPVEVVDAGAELVLPARTMIQVLLHIGLRQG